MRSFCIAAVLSIVLVGCSEQIYLVGIDSDPEKATRIFYIPTVNKQVPKAELDTTKHTADKIFKVLSAALIKDFGAPEDIQETGLKEAGADYSYQYKDWDGDGVKDLFAINRNGFSATDIYILSGATGFKGFLLQQPIGIPKSDYHTDFDVSDADNDGVEDLFVFERNGNNKVNLIILSGRVSAAAPAFMHKLYETTLGFADPNSTKAFEMYDIDKDGLPDLVVIDKEFRSTAGSKETKVLVYSGASEFQKLIFGSVTPIHHSCTGCTFVMDEFLAENTLDLISINDSDPKHTTIDVLSGASKFLGFLKQDTLKLDASFQDAVFFSDNKLPETSGSTKGLTTTFNPRPILKNVSGPQDLTEFVGQWELHSTFHSNDNNSRTGIVIDERTLDAQLNSDGWQGISITFEDGYTITCDGKDGNIVCSDNYKIASVHHNYFYLVDEIGNHDKIERYLGNHDLGYLVFHNGAAYDAHVWGSWTEIGFGGKETEVSTEKFYLSLAGGLETIGVNDEHVFVIPQSAKHVRLHIDPVDGRDKIITISNPPIDNSCYRIRGDLLSAAFSSNYKYYDRDCTESSRSKLIGSTIAFQNTDLFKVISSRIKNLHKKGFFDDLHPNDPNSHETARKAVFDVQVKEAIADHNSTYGNGGDTEFSIKCHSTGFGGGVEIIVGYAGDSGIIKDDDEKVTRVYHTNGVSWGAEIGAELSVVFGMWGQHASEMTTGWSYGGGAGIGLGVGFTLIAWTPELGSNITSGITISIDLGVEGKAIEFLYSKTVLGPTKPFDDPVIYPGEIPIVD